MALYREMDRAALDAAYNNRAAVPAHPALLARRKARSEEIRRARRFQADLRYGPGERERLDFFPAQRPGAPLLLFIHGGYWQSNDKEPSSFVVEGPLERGLAVALVEYTLAPQADMARIVAEIRRAVDWLAAHAAELGADPRRLLACGHSAGGHLAAMVLDKPCVAGALPISGLFELEPIRLSYLNEKLALDAASAREFSPLLHLPARCAPLTVAVGGDELPELRRQSADYAAALAARGLKAKAFSLPGHDHFSILDELAQADGRLCAEAARLLEAPLAA